MENSQVRKNAGVAAIIAFFGGVLCVAAGGAQRDSPRPQAGEGWAGGDPMRGLAKAGAFAIRYALAFGGKKRSH